MKSLQPGTLVQIVGRNNPDRLRKGIVGHRSGRRYCIYLDDDTLQQRWMLRSQLKKLTKESA